jgi:hypothetical protein
MNNLGTQLHDFMEHVVERADVDALPVRLDSEETRSTATKAPRPGWVIAVATAITVLLLVGGSNALFNAYRSTPPGDEDAPTTAETPAEEEITTTTEVVVAPTTIGQVTVDVASSVVAGLGTLKWERVTGDVTTIPQNIDAHPDGGFVAYEGTKIWRSDDALTWTATEVAPQFVDYQWVWVKDGWAIGSTEDSEHLYEAVGDEWVRVELPDPPFPQTPGVKWPAGIGIPKTVGDVSLIDGTTSGWVSWGEVYGTFEVPCGEPEPCEMDPWTEWDPPSTTLRVMHPENGATLAVLTAAIEGDSITFVDTGSDEIVHTVTGTEDWPAERIVQNLQRGEGLVFAGGWVSEDGGPWVWSNFPFQSQSRLLVVPDGGFAVYDIVYDWMNQPESPIVSATVWMSDGGMEWTDHGEPAFLDAAAEHMWVDEVGQRVRATVITGYNDTTGMEEFDAWESTDGLRWEPVDSPFSSWSQEFETDFGLVTTAMPQSVHMFWVSTDGANWHEVLGPPGSHEPAGAGYAAAGAAGEILWTAVGEDSGSRSLWIGRFEPEP